MNGEKTMNQGDRESPDIEDIDNRTSPSPHGLVESRLWGDIIVGRGKRV
jgi:hypothetical protein